MGTKAHHRTLVTVATELGDRLLLWAKETPRRELILFQRVAHGLFPQNGRVPDYKAAPTQLHERKYTIHLAKSGSRLNCVSKQTRFVELALRKRVIPTTAIAVENDFFPLYVYLSGTLGSENHLPITNPKDTLRLEYFNTRKCSIFYCVLISKPDREVCSEMLTSHDSPFRIATHTFESFRLTILYTYTAMPSLQKALSYVPPDIPPNKFHLFESVPDVGGINSYNEEYLRFYLIRHLVAMANMLSTEFLPPNYLQEFDRALFAWPFRTGESPPKFLQSHIKQELHNLTLKFGPPNFGAQHKEQA